MNSDDNQPSTMTTELQYEPIPATPAKEPQTLVDRMWKEMEVLTSKATALVPHLEFIEQLRKELPADFPIDCLSFGLQNGQVQGALIHLNCPTKKHLKEIAAKLTSSGYHIKGHDDYEELQRRTYDYGPIKVMAFFYGAGATCKFVEVGKKEEPVYAFKCEEDAQ